MSGYYSKDENVPTEFHMRLLAHKDFDFSPFWEEAVVNWLHKNSTRLLMKDPQCCKHFIGDKQQRFTIARHIPLDDIEEIKKFVMSLSPSDDDPDVYFELAERLIDVGKVDILTETKLTPLFYIEKDDAHLMRSSAGDDATKIINAFSDDSIVQVFNKLPWSECRWDIDPFTALIRRLPVEHLGDAEVEKIRPYIERRYRSEDKVIFRTRNRVACLLATILPKEDLLDFIGRLTTVTNTLDCMSCGEMVANSKPGYTLHRKVCDPHNQYPNALITAATRLL